MSDTTDDIWEQPTIRVGEARPCVGESGSPSPWSVGAIVDQRYRILAIHGGPGVTGMGIVYIVEVDGRRYAAKTFQRHFASDLALVQRFLHEARTWMLLGFHPNIVSARGLEIIEATPYLVMEYVEPDSHGVLSLAEHIRRGPLDPARAIDLAIQCCNGMSYANQSVPGLVHRDLKPENLLITRDGTLKISDFGLVRCHIADTLEPSRATAFPDAAAPAEPNAAMGTPAYMAPEQFAGGDGVTQRTDLYAFGCCFYESLAGRHLFEISRTTPLVRAVYAHLNQQPLPLLEHVADCPKELSDIIMRCIEKDPAERWSDFEEVGDRLRAVYRTQFGLEHRPRTMKDPSPEDVGSQVRALSLLDGYTRAIQLRHVRDSQNASPYAFHLALASYFHCNEDSAEERRQLEKALRCRNRERGDETVRRLAERLVEAGEWDKADELLDDFLKRFPDSLHLVLDPYIRLLVARGDFEEAESILENAEENISAEMLWGVLYGASHRYAEWASLLSARAASLMRNLRATLAGLRPGNRIGWDLREDPEVLKKFLGLTCPELDADLLDNVEHAFWPDITAYPDFAGDMAWLSEVYGELAHLTEGITEEQRAAYHEIADLLGFPHRLKRYLERDEAWLWFTMEEDGLPG